ncbi:MAG: MFS transporter [Chloroflexi bacterium]|nr:MFS transporter [Chloroflexota bacterium]MDA1271626.1 MFS transporter [Chloroflexota bacterium]
MILGILAAAQIVGQSISMAAGIMVAPLNDPTGGFGWNLGVIGAALATYYLCGALVAPLTGMLGDRFGARPLMFACGLLYAISMILIGTVTHLWQFFLYFGVMLSVTQSLAMVPILASVNGWFKRRLGLATGLLWASGGIGAAAVAPSIASLLNAVGWQTTFTIIGLAGGGTLTLLTLLFRSKPADAGAIAYGTQASDPREIRRSKEVERLRLKVFNKAMRRTRAFWNLPTIHGLGCAGHGIVLIYSIPLAVEQGVSLSAASFILALISIFSILGRFIAPILAERIGAKPVMMTALFVQGITVLVLFWASDAFAFYLFAILFGLGFGGEMSAYLVVNRQYFGSGPLATLYGFEMMGALSGHATATVLGGLAIYATGSFNPALVMSMLFSFTGVLVIASMESGARVLIPDWESNLPPEARTTPELANQAVRAALLEQTASD